MVLLDPLESRVRRETEDFQVHRDLQEARVIVVFQVVLAPSVLLALLACPALKDLRVQRVHLVLQVRREIPVCPDLLVLRVHLEKSSSHYLSTHQRRLAELQMQ